MRSQVDNLYKQDNFLSDWLGSDWIYLSNTILVPFIFSLIYIFIYPLIDLQIHRWVLWRELKTRKVIHHFQEITPITPKQQKEQLASYQSEINRLNQEIEKRDHSIERLSAKAEADETLDNRLERIEGSIPETIDEIGAPPKKKQINLSDGLTDIQKDVLFILADDENKKGIGMDEDQLLQAINREKTRGIGLAEPTYDMVTLRIGISDLLNLELIRENKSKYPYFYQLESVGKKIYQEIFLKSVPDNKEKIVEKEVQLSEGSIELSNLARTMLRRSVTREEMSGEYQTVEAIRQAHGKAAGYSEALAQLKTQGLWEVAEHENPDHNYYMATDKGRRVMGKK